MFTILNKNWRRAEVRIADLITRLSGSMLFVYLHILGFTLFFIFQPFDTTIFNILLSLEAVFLATFIMVAQNRQAEILEERAREEEQEEEETREDLEDIQEDFDSLRKDLDGMRSIIERLEQHLQQRQAEPFRFPKA
jgi:uncharacterized membrane protein